MDTCRPADGRARWLSIFLIAGVALEAVVVLLSLVEWRFFPGFGAQAEAATAGEALLALGFLFAGGANLLVFVTTAALFCFWVHRANANARALGAAGMAFTPGWTVGYFFIPVLNLYKPYRAVAEVFQASDPAASAETWKDSPAPSLLRAWWGAWLLNGVLGQASWRMARQKASYAAGTVAAVDVASGLAGVAAGVLCLLVVRAIQSRQAQKASLKSA